MKRPKSLKRPLIIQPLIVQLVTLLVMSVALIAIALRADVGGLYTDETITPVIAGAVIRGGNGGLSIQPTAELTALQRETPDLWFVAEDQAGYRVTYGRIPSEYASLVGVLRSVGYAHLRDRRPPYRLSAVIRQEMSPAGPVTILGHGKLTGLTFTVLMASNVLVIPIIAIFAAIAALLIPWIVRRSLAGVNRIAAEAGQIDPDVRGWRLRDEEVPSEIAPLVRAVNDALARLDEAYDRQRRFIASAAHEIRTPIAIIRTKIDASGEVALRRLSGDVDRLANLAEQLLDLERIDTRPRMQTVDLAPLARRVIGELAPLAIASDRTIEIECDHPSTIQSDRGAIERVLVSLIHNAIDHGGPRIIVRVAGTTLAVEDDGDGIPAEARTKVLEPFYRLKPRSTGAGLGLNLVKQIVERLRGRLSITAAVPTGTIVEVWLPAEYAVHR